MVEREKEMVLEEKLASVSVCAGGGGMGVDHQQLPKREVTRQILYRS